MAPPAASRGCCRRPRSTSAVDARRVRKKAAGGARSQSRAAAAVEARRIRANGLAIPRARQARGAGASRGVIVDGCGGGKRRRGDTSAVGVRFVREGALGPRRALSPTASVSGGGDAGRQGHDERYPDSTRRRPTAAERGRMPRRRSAPGRRRGAAAPGPAVAERRVEGGRGRAAGAVAAQRAQHDNKPNAIYGAPEVLRIAKYTHQSGFPCNEGGGSSGRKSCWGSRAGRSQKQRGHGEAGGLGFGGLSGLCVDLLQVRTREYRVFVP